MFVHVMMDTLVMIVQKKCQSRHLTFHYQQTVCVEQEQGLVKELIYMERSNQKPYGVDVDTFG